MSPRTQNASGAITDADQVAGPDAYPAGGWELDVNLGRVDDYDVAIDDAAYEARVTGVNNAQNLVVTVSNQDGTGEIADGTDLSGTTIRYSATRL
jgi:hypothetical protein